MAEKVKNSDYTAVLLAAGYGSRISDLTHAPKSLLKINGQTLLEKNFETWKSLGIRKVNLVLGYENQMIEDIAKKYEADFDFTYSLNEDYRKQGNTFSLLLGVKELEGPSLIFDADLVYEASILDEFLKDKEGSQILVGEGSIDDIECAKTLVDKEGYARMTIDKRAITEEELAKFSFAGEAIGILKFSAEQTKRLADMAENFLSMQENLHKNWEHLLNEYLLENNVGTHLFKGGRWFEIDTPEDYQEAMIIFGD